MKIKWSLFGSRARKKKDIQQKLSRKGEVIKATEITLGRYAKTFKDLARYDRGERTAPSPVSR